MTGTRGQARASVAISEPSSAEELEACFAFRWKLLRAPWKQPPGSERDEFEATAHHLIARNYSGEIVAVGRIHFPSGSQAQIRYMATRKDFRRQGIGSEIVAQLDRFAQDDDPDPPGAVGRLSRYSYSLNFSSESAGGSHPTRESQNIAPSGAMPGSESMLPTGIR